MTVGTKAVIDRAVIFALAAVFILQQLTQWGPLVYVLGGLSFMAVLLLLPKLKGIALWLSLFFMAGGVVLMLAQQAAAAYWFKAASMNATLVTLFVFAPLFGIPVRLPDYVAALKRFYETRMRSTTALFIGTQLMTHIMGGFINVGSIPVVYHLVFVKPRSGHLSGLLANALNRGFGGAICWSPYFAAMALVTSALKLNWSALLPYLIGLSLISLLVSLAVDFKQLRAKDEASELAASQTDELSQEVVEVTTVAPSTKATQAIENQRGQSMEKEHERRASFPMGLAIYLLCATAAILLLEQLIELPMVLITCMGAVVFPLLWCLAKGALPTFRQGLKNHLTVTLPALQKEITLFLAAGFFSGSIGATGFGNVIPSLLGHMPLPIAWSFSIFTIVMIAATSLIGLHPIVLVTILATSIDPAVVQISPIYFAVLLLGSWGLSNPISPASAVNNLLAGLFNKSVFELARPNYRFAAVMGLALLLYLMMI
ncbi:hypothetical protein BBD42_09610 [Paenibacillus sp. BIHB 4019]|uniref:Citrate transporter-like domain-containing protein n=1 Tax=Paenibacillus sp. BIHB 4019 TaxID=1870819 RepID=A0A1B2DG48_9BACL|nr:hypothetical protein [Paenibacillus sp. BIHB 4019]ANY66690.1 hypothetical protein BBD42_09610 [Paenibacillus sp. BIHB 4019]